MLAFNHLGKLGQLGNQMFQYAALRGIASKVASEFMIPNHQEIYDDGIGNRYGILLFDAFKLVHVSNYGILKIFWILTGIALGLLLYLGDKYIF